jgi:hypothetical protein
MKRKKKTSRRKSHRRTPSVAYVANPARKKTRRKARAKSMPWAAPRRKSYRKNPGFSKYLQPVIKLGIGGAVGLGGGKLISMLPISALMQNISMVAAGILMMVFGQKYSVAKYGGFGLALVGGTRQILNMVPALAGDNELTQDQQLALLGAMSEDPELMGADYTDAELVNGPMNGPMNGESNPFNMNG